MDIDTIEGCRSYVCDDNGNDASIPMCKQRACTECLYGKNKPAKINKQLLEQVLKLEP